MALGTTLVRLYAFDDRLSKWKYQKDLIGTTSTQKKKEEKNAKVKLRETGI